MSLDPFPPELEEDKSLLCDTVDVAAAAAAAGVVVWRWWWRGLIRVRATGLWRVAVRREMNVMVGVAATFDACNARVAMTTFGVKGLGGDE